MEWTSQAREILIAHLEIRCKVTVDLLNLCAGIKARKQRLGRVRSVDLIQ